MRKTTLYCQHCNTRINKYAKLLLLIDMSNKHLIYHTVMAVLLYLSLAAILLRLFSVLPL